MARIRHSANSGRHRARLISTPHTPEGTPPMTTTIEGVKFSDQLGALLDHATAHGFRVESATNGKRAGTVTLYAPDKDVAPIAVNERGAKFNRAHYENIRRDLYRAGCPPLPADAKNDPAAHDAEPPAAAAADDAIDVIHIHNTAALDRMLADPAKRVDVIAGMTASLLNRADAPLSVVAALTAGLVTEVATWAEAVLPEITKQCLADARLELGREVDEALRMASEWEATATRAQAALDKATEREDRARRDCGEAIARAKAAETEATELRNALAPLRALLGK